MAGWPFALLAALAAVTIPLAASAQVATSQELAQAQTKMFAAYEPGVQAFAQKLNLTEPWITYCRVQMNEAHAGHALDGTLPFGVDYKAINRDQLGPLIMIRGAYEEGYLRKCLADVRGSLKLAGVD